jgi:hypothetical protein
MDEASSTAWSAEHLPVVGSLTTLRSLCIKIPPYRSSRPETGPPAGSQPSALASWTALQQLTKLHVSALRYSFHSSLVSVLPSLTKVSCQSASCSNGLCAFAGQRNTSCFPRETLSNSTIHPPTLSTAAAGLLGAEGAADTPALARHGAAALPEHRHADRPHAAQLDAG